ncbi:flagellar hook-length control protein FliK [Acidithiobacillus concretivorus]|uniref:Flagellar hook-length control protein FliK n=1 Tax=Acidithiobacillus concretivorus TaxID=3063952 RepID=A0ABS5ZT09_9PROT|nr:flagellar hook-length control protein FliK [Acidithiobacillus concretivorus]MBU2739094.1 flagellar hook-length control protein FliK [Acidithiobacillus concretivorus]
MAAVSIVNPVSSSGLAANPLGKVSTPAGNEKPDSIKFVALMAKQQSRETPPQKSPEHTHHDPNPNRLSPPSAETVQADATPSVQSVSGKSLPQSQSNPGGQNGSVAKEGDHKKSKDQSVNPSTNMTENALLPSGLMPLPVTLAPGSSQALSSVDVSGEGNAAAHRNGLGNQSAQVSENSILRRSSQSGLLQLAAADHAVTDNQLTASVAHSANQDGSSSQIVGHFLQNLARAFAASSTTGAQSVASSAFSNSRVDASTPLLKTVSDSGASLADNSAQPLLASTIMLPPVASTPSAQVVAAPVGANPQWGEALGQQVQFLLGQGIQQATLQLNPPHLGPLEVHLDIQANGQANATFISPHPEVLQAISTAIPQLQQSFAAAGMSLGQANVGADGGGRFFSKNRPAPAGTVKSTTEPLDSTTSSTILRVHLGLINAFA